MYKQAKRNDIEDEYKDEGFDEENYDDDDNDDIADESPTQNDASNDLPTGNENAANMVGNGQIQNDLVDKEVE